MVHDKINACTHTVVGYKVLLVFYWQVSVATLFDAAVSSAIRFGK